MIVPRKYVHEKTGQVGWIEEQIWNDKEQRLER